MYVGANYSVQGAPLTGLIQTRLSTGHVVTLDLNKIAERLWAVELASLHRTVQDIAEEKSRR